MTDPSPDGDPPGVRFVWLDGNAIEAVDRLHRRSIAALEPALVKPERRSFFEGVFAGRGEVIGAIVEGSDAETGVADGRLAGYGVLLTELADGEDAGVRIGLGSNIGLAKIAGTGVDPADRGRGLQRALARRRIARAGARGFRHVFATAAPGNTVSWRNLMTEGFAIVDVVLAYGSLERFLMHRPVGSPTHPDQSQPVWCPAQPTDDVRAALSSGLIGPLWRERRSSGACGFDIGFVPSLEQRA